MLTVFGNLFRNYSTIEGLYIHIQTYDIMVNYFLE